MSQHANSKQRCKAAPTDGNAMGGGGPVEATGGWGGGDDTAAAGGEEASWNTGSGDWQ